MPSRCMPFRAGATSRRYLSGLRKPLQNKMVVWGHRVLSEVSEPKTAQTKSSQSMRDFLRYKLFQQIERFVRR